MSRIVVVGAGIGGLTAAALLARAGEEVIVLEAHIYPGGCAGTFYHQGYRFDAGATLAAGFGSGGLMERLGKTLDIDWPVELAEVAMVVHLPHGRPIVRLTDGDLWRTERLAAFGREAEPFWRWQERQADTVWRMAESALPWPPQGMREAFALARAGLTTTLASPGRLPGLLADAVRPVAAHLPMTNERLRTFVDAQLLISAQTTSRHANALYGAAALDLARRGVAHLLGGMGALGQRLVDAIRGSGGRVLFRQKVTRVTAHNSGSVIVKTARGEEHTADVVLFNTPPGDAASLLADPAAVGLAHAGPPADGWGAFVVYAGIDGETVPAGLPLHHQIIMGEPLAEGNSVFLSLSLEGDNARAPAGRRAVTLSTHTRLETWWELMRNDPGAYEARKEAYTERVLDAAIRVLPGIRKGLQVCLPGTPPSFQRFTYRGQGWVGGFPQTSLSRAQAPRVAERLWLVGDSIFPGQSTVAVALGGMRVAKAVQASLAGHRGKVQVEQRSTVSVPP